MSINYIVEEYFLKELFKLLPSLNKLAALITEKVFIEEFKTLTLENNAEQILRILTTTSKLIQKLEVKEKLNECKRNERA